ncbi:MAG: tyrosine-protein phosphatase [Bryobacteraceae bacterium]
MRSKQYLLSFSITVGLTMASACASAPTGNLPNFQKVDDHLYRGAQPSERGFQDIAELGVKTVIDLRENIDHSQAEEQKEVTNLGMRYISIPMEGMSTPKNDQVAQVMALLNDPAAGPVFVHCKRGADRTGMVIAVYRISHDGWENKKALSEAKSYGMSPFQRSIQHYITDYKPAPEAASSSGAAH